MNESEMNLHLEPKYNNLVLSGGSVKAIAHIGAIKKLIDEKLIDLKKLKAVAGSSAGVLLGALIVMGFSIDEIWDFILNLDFKKLIKPEFLLFFKCGGIESGDTIRNLFEEILTKKTGIKQINFKQLYDITHIHFIVTASNLTEKKEIYYDYINTPDFVVSMAIRISISLPGLFVPVVIDNNTYIDGGVLNNYPMNLFQDKLDDTIGILICNDYTTKYKYIEEYIIATMNLFAYGHFRETQEKYQYNTVLIKQLPDNVFSFNFDINNKTKFELYKCGLISAEEFVSSHRKITEIKSKPIVDITASSTSIIKSTSKSNVTEAGVITESKYSTQTQ